MDEVKVAEIGLLLEPCPVLPITDIVEKLIREKSLHQQFNKFFRTQPGLADYCPQGTPVQSFMIGYNHLSERLVPPQDHVTSLLTFHEKACFS